VELYACVKILAMPSDELEQRPEDDDYDLLTFGEAGARLVEEVRRQRRLIESLSDAGAEPSSAGAEPGELAKAVARLDALLAAQERNRKPSIEEMRASGFFAPPNR
jgi:hypothetical protein